MRSSNLLAGAALLGSAFAAATSSSKPLHHDIPTFYNGARHAGSDPYAFWDSATGQYYAYSTEGADEGYNFAIYSSPDLSTWHKHPGGVLKACYDADMNRIEGGQACWAGDWFWAPETYYNEKTGWYFFFFAGRLHPDYTKDYFRYSAFEEPSKIGVAVSRTPLGPFEEIESKPIEYYPFDPNYHDVNLIMDKEQMLPPKTEKEGETAPKGTYIPTIDVNIYFDTDDRVYMYVSRNAYRNWNWDDKLGKYIEESNIIVVEMERDWWDDPEAKTMPEILESQRDIHSKDAPELPKNITSYNGVGEIGDPPRKDGWKTVISYGADPQDWENAHVDDYKKFNGTKKDRRWSEGSTTLTRPDSKTGKPVYLLTYSANNYEASNYGVGFATAESPLGPFRKSTNNPVLSQEPDGEVPVYSVGHGSVVASPPRNSKEKIGALEVTHKTPGGSELFYVHHGRNDTAVDRSIYTTRMTLDDKSIYFKSNDALSMDLTPLDQPLPKNTYPIEIEAKCRKSRGKPGFQVDVEVTSKPGGPFDLEEGSNRVVAFPGSREAKSIEAIKEGSYTYTFDKLVVRVDYQRMNVDGSWSTDASKWVLCI